MAPKAQPGVAHSLLSRAHSPDTANRIFTDKIQHRPLLLRPSSPPPGHDLRIARRKARAKKLEERAKALKPKPLSSRQRRKLQLYQVPREGQKYATFEPLHHLWLGYIREILGHEIYAGGQGAASKLSSADFHGAEVEVVRSHCPSRVGLKGIVIKDTRHIFEVITEKNKLKLVPKEGTIFRVEIPVEVPVGGTQTHEEPGEIPQAGSELPRQMVVEVHGEQFLHRAADRATKKFKSHFLTHL